MEKKKGRAPAVRCMFAGEGQDLQELILQSFRCYLTRIVDMGSPFCCHGQKE